MSLVKLEPAFPYTSIQAALLRLRNGEKKVAVEIGTTTPLRYCTGRDPIEHDSAWYLPKGLEVGEVEIAGAGSGMTISFDNTDGVLSYQNFVETFSNVDVEVHFFLRERKEAWTYILSLSWTCETIGWSRNTIQLNLGWGVGVRPRAGLEVASQRCPLVTHWDTTKTPKGGPLCQYNGSDNRCMGTWDDCKAKGNTPKFRGWRMAPEPGYSLRVESGSFQFQGGYGGIDPPPGDDDGTNPIYRKDPRQRRVTPDPPPEPPPNTPMDNPNVSTPQVD